MSLFFVNYESGNVVIFMKQNPYLKATILKASQEISALNGKRIFTRKYRDEKYA